MTFVVDDIGELNSLFESIETAVQNADYTEVMEQGEQSLAEQHAGMFAGEYDSNLVDWKPLKESTIRRKKHDRILVETGALRESLVAVGGPSNVHETTRSGLVYGTGIDYAGYLQEGTSRMPARPPVGISDETLDKIVNQVADATVELLRG